MVFQPFCYFGPHKYAVIIKLNCETDSVAGRNKIANQLQIDVRYVTLWLKQADLWRIPDMDANLAYLAVLAGVRHVEDYAKVDPQKLMPVLRTLVASHPDMKLPNEETVSMSIDYAKLFVKNMSGKTYLKDDMAAKKVEREGLLVEIYGFDPVTNDLEKTLTNLLARTDFSTILAPGEEQRLVVRESSQSYEVLDTAKGSEAVAEDYTTSQVDDTTATYNYAVNQLMTGESSSKFQVKSTSVGFAAAGGYNGCSLGLNVGHSKTSGNASSSSRQNNSHDEASAAAQNFQHGIKTASERISQAKRISMRAATSNETDW